jgi:acyl-CoA thioester hydrolase
MSDQPFRYRVYWEDTDAGGVVYHARYLAFFERGRSDWLMAMGFPQVPMRERDNRLFVVRRIDIRFVAPARLEDELAITIDVEHLRSASLTFNQHMHRVGDEQLLATARVDAACLAADRFAPARMPEDLRAAIQQQQQRDKQ